MMMCGVGQEPEPEADGTGSQAAEFTALLEDSAEDLYENAPCGYLSTLLDGQVAKVNTTLLSWLGHAREELVGRTRFTDLLTVGGKLYHETHFSPLLRMQGEVSGIALDLVTSGGDRLPVLVNSTVKTGSDGEPLLIRTTVFDAGDRRSYEQELLTARKEAEAARAEAERAQHRAEEERERLQKVLATWQRSLLPPSLPQIPGLEAAAYYHTASSDHLGGDFYDLFPLGRDSWGFFLGDVCGKGPEAATITSLARHTLHAAALHDPDPVTSLTTLNAVLHDSEAEDLRFCTVIAGTLTRTRDGFNVSLASGGHPSALRLGADGNADYLPTPGGLLLGVVDQPHFASAGTTLGPGDTLLLYTDGLTEARTPQEEGGRYSDEALHAFARSLAPAGADEAIGALSGLLHDFGDGLNDDTAILALGVPARAVEPE